MSKKGNISFATTSSHSYSPSTLSAKRRNQQVPQKKKCVPFIPKDDWNTYLTDADQYKVPEEEIVKKKQQYVSKHNILSDQYQPPKPKTKLKVPKAPKDLFENTEETTFIESSGEKHNSLDLLELDSEGNHEESDAEEQEEEKMNHVDFMRTKRTVTPRKAPVVAASSSSQQQPVVKTVKPTIKKVKSTPTKAARPFLSENDKIPDEDLSSMSTEIRLLFQELQYFEEVFGKKNQKDNIASFQSKELMHLLPEEELNGNNLDQKKVIRFLVQLVRTFFLFFSSIY
jgi:hypothetical protein